MKVGINGYGTIGKRVADVIVKHSKMDLAGVAKYTPDQDAKLANILGIDLFVPGESIDTFKASGIEVAGSVDELVDESDVVVDASTDKKGVLNKNAIYLPKRKKAIFQGGEEANVADVSFNARSNFDSALGKNYVRVVSCNTTSYCRIIKPLAENFDIESISAFLIRRGADPNDAKGSALNAIEWKAMSHHADDIRTVIDVPITSVAFKVPHTLAHINSMSIRFKGRAPGKDEFFNVLKKESRLALLKKASTSSQIIETSRDLGLKRYDTFIPAVLMNTFQSNGNDIFIAFSVPQESVVVPENIDAIMAQSGMMSRESSMDYTNEILGIPKIKSSLERLFG